MKILVVGAGLAGATYARVLAEAGHEILIIDRRDHVGGNCFDFRNAQGVLIHKYGPHLFHTSNQRVVDWLGQFTEWLPYEHRVVAMIEGGALVPMPVNRTTIERFFGVDLPDAATASAFLKTQVRGFGSATNAAQHLEATIGPALTEVFFRRYNRKMWKLDLEEIDAKVVQRLTIRLDTEDRYFPNDTFQALPKEGYTRTIEKILDHRLIKVETGRTFARADEVRFDHIFNSMPIDAYYESRFGELPYRSIRFHHSSEDKAGMGRHVTINFTDYDRFTRMTCWNNLPAQPDCALNYVTREEPCDYRDNDFERYYPVKTVDGRIDAILARYQSLAANQPNMTFIGRCGTYQYLDMHQVINQALMGSAAFLKARG